MERVEGREAAAELDIAIVGMSVRFPGAGNVEEFWRNLRDGVESVRNFSEEELRAAGVPDAALADPRYVRAGAVLEDVESFDATFFGFYPRDAELLDPQQRLFLECSWESLEDAGYDPERYEGAVGVYAGAGINAYLINNILSNPELADRLDPYQFIIQNDKDFLASRVSFKLNLKGPSVVVQTACSTSLVAVHMACQGLLNYQCDMALAGGVTIRVPQRSGYLYQEGGIVSPDGHCRAFDALAQGTVGGNGAGVVVLKRLADAVADGDEIRAVIKGSAVNNDGAAKIGYTAPGLDGQAEVIETALSLSGVEAETISYVEAHGTGTRLGDPVEMAALARAFGASTKKKNFCAVGSVKTNVGHLDTAAGVAGLVKTALALRHGLIPPSLHYRQPNPAIDFADSPFYVNARLAPWESGQSPRRAGVSSFGIGGTNAHVILEEAPPREVSPSRRPYHLLTLSAKTATALEAATANLAEHLSRLPDADLPDLAYTLQMGRREFAHRRFVVCRDGEEAREALRSPAAPGVQTGLSEWSEPPVVFMFPGQGAQHPRMGLGLYQTEASFRREVDRCAETLAPHLGLDLRRLLFPPDAELESSARALNQTAVTQPALFVLEYALARLWTEWGVRPKAMVGHSIGEYVAACMAGVMSLEDALALVAYRGRLMQGLPRGAMLSVQLAPSEAEPLLGPSLSLASVNTPSSCVVSGRVEAVEELEALLARRGMASRRLETSHAFHSEMMQPIVDAFAERVGELSLRPPRTAYLSNLTGTWITEREATDPRYWASHLRQTVQFSSNVRELLKTDGCVMLEVGPGQTLRSLARRHLRSDDGRAVLSSLPHPRQPRPEQLSLLETLGRLWLNGVEVDWAAFHDGEKRRRVPAPTYPFERQRYWIDPPGEQPGQTPRAASLPRRNEIARWFSTPLWKQSLRAAPAPTAGQDGRGPARLLFADECGLCEELAERLRRRGESIVTVRAGEQFAKLAEDSYTLNPRREADYPRLLESLDEVNGPPSSIIHAWGVSAGGDATRAHASFDDAQGAGFYSLIFLARALAKRAGAEGVEICVLSNGVQSVTGEEALTPEKATALAPCRIIPQEYPHVACRSIDLLLYPRGGKSRERLVEQLMAEVCTASADPSVALRGDRRWVETLEPVFVGEPARETVPLKSGGVYLITGGLGRIGLALAEHLARSAGARLVLVGRAGLPARDEWGGWLSAHGEDEPVSRRIKKVQSFEALGAEVLVARADAADEEQMRAAVSAAVLRFGRVDGVIHAAGLVGEEWLRMIDETDVTLCEAHFRAKARGALVLEKLFAGESLDFCVLLSSLSSVLGGLGYTAYAAANIFMDCLARRMNASGGTRWLSVNWDGWRGDAETPRAAGAGADAARMAITPDEGVEAFRRALSLIANCTQVVVSTTDLAARFNRWVGPGGRRDGAEPAETGTPARLHTRPALANDYVAPRDELELRVAELWKESLGIGQVGREDDFFALGGDSLLATQLLTSLRGSFGVELSVGEFFSAPTVAALSEAIGRRRAEREEEERAEVLRLLSSLSEEEAEAELHRRQ